MYPHSIKAPTGKAMTPKWRLHSGFHLISCAAPVCEKVWIEKLRLVCSKQKKIVQISVEVKNQILSDKHMYIGASRCATILEFFLDVFFSEFFFGLWWRRRLWDETLTKKGWWWDESNLVANERNLLTLCLLTSQEQRATSAQTSFNLKLYVTKIFRLV